MVSWRVPYDHPEEKKTWIIWTTFSSGRWCYLRMDNSPLCGPFLRMNDSDEGQYPTNVQNFASEFISPRRWMVRQTVMCPFIVWPHGSTDPDGKLVSRSSWRRGKWTYLSKLENNVKLYPTGDTSVPNSGLSRRGFNNKVHRMTYYMALVTWVSIA